MNILEVLKRAKTILAEAKVENPSASAEFLLSRVIDKPKEYLFGHSDYMLTAVEAELFDVWILRRAKHEPVWYITGKIDFMGLELAVDKNVLIPRPETELLIEKIIEFTGGGFAPKNILEIGTGSGAIVLALASHIFCHPEQSEGSRTSILDSSVQPQNDESILFFASDISPEALKVAKSNAKSLNLKDKIDFQEGDLFEPWSGQRFDLIVANLPYVPEGDKDSLAVDLTLYEPHLALFGGADGLVLIYRLLDGLLSHLNMGGKVFLEIGYGQGDKIKEYTSKLLPTAVTTVVQDYASVDRIVIIET